MGKNEFLKYVKNKMQTLDDYTEGEEKLLIMDSLNLSPEKLFLLEDFSEKEQKIVGKNLARRLKGEPLNKIFGVQNFYGYDFFINKNVLAPRKETEGIAEECIRRSKFYKEPKILDLCCGSGAIGITICKEVNTLVTLSDISTKALYIARKNAKKLGANVKIIKRNMLERNTEKYDIIVCNPPYIRTLDIPRLSTGVKNYDPHIALDGGEDGLNFYKYLARKVDGNLSKQGTLLLEIGCDQYKDVKKIFEDKGYRTWHLLDYANYDRIVVVKRKGQDYD